MELTRLNTAADFRARAEAFLLQHEAGHNLMLGLTTVLAFKPDLYSSPPYLAVVEDAGRVVAAAVMTPPQRLVVSRGASPEALGLIARDVLAFRPETPGVTGPVPSGLRFAEIWRGLTGRPFRRSMAERLYKLERVRHPAGVTGQMRPITQADRALLLEWMEAFNREAFQEEEPDPAALERIVDYMLTQPPEMTGAFLWVDGEPVSFTRYGGPTPNSMRLGPVYTPPRFRGRGYASACVAAVSQYLLDSGRKFCTLFTDLANPTSNKIYQQIGYEPVCDVDEYRFGS